MRVSWCAWVLFSSKHHERLVVASRWCFVPARTTKISWFLCKSLPYWWFHKKYWRSVKTITFSKPFFIICTFYFFFEKTVKCKRECKLLKNLERLLQPKFSVKKCFFSILLMRMLRCLHFFPSKCNQFKNNKSMQVMLNMKNAILSDYLYRGLVICVNPRWVTH